MPAHIGAFPCSEALRSFSEFYLYFLRRFSRSTRHLPSCLFCVNFRNWKSRKKPQECGQPFSPSLRLMSTLEPRARRSLVLCSNLIRSLLRCLPHPQSMPPSPPSPPSKSSPDFLNSVGHKETGFFSYAGYIFWSLLGFPHFRDRKELLRHCFSSDPVQCPAASALLWVRYKLR